MPKKKLSSKNLNMTDLLELLNARSMIQLTPPVRESQTEAWNALTAALLGGRCDLIVKQVSEDGGRYVRVRHNASHGTMTLRMARASIEYVLRPTADTPRWAEG